MLRGINRHQYVGINNQYNIMWYNINIIILFICLGLFIYPNR